MINDFLAAVEPIKFKNNGGCLFFCYVFWLWLKQQGLPTDSYNIVQYTGPWGSMDGYNVRQNKKWIENKGAGLHPESSYHFTWMYEGREYDATGLVNKAEHKNGVILNGLNGPDCTLVEEFCIQALTHACWNSQFEREPAIQFIKRNMGIDASL